MRQLARSGCGLLIAMLLGHGAGPSPAWAQDIDTIEGLILTTARARDLARATLVDAVVPIGSVLTQIGPASVFAADAQGAGNWSLALGVAGAEFNVTNPDYTVADPAGDDRIKGAVGAAFADLSVGLFRGYEPSASVTTMGSIDLLLRLGFSLGDQENLAEEVDLSSWGPIFGGGLRFGLLKGPSVPSVSLAAGANHFQRRTFTVLVEDEDAEVNLDIEETSFFLMLEVGKSFGWITPYVVGGGAHHRLQAEYVAEVIYAGQSDFPVTVHDAVDDKQSIGVIYGGVELGSGRLRIDLEAGTSDGEPFGRFFLRFAG